MYKKSNDNEYSFTINKVEYNLEIMPNSVEIYETDNPAKTGFVFDGGLKQFVLFINTITDITESVLEENSKDEIR